MTLETKPRPAAHLEHKELIAGYEKKLADTHTDRVGDVVTLNVPERGVTETRIVVNAGNKATRVKPVNSLVTPSGHEGIITIPGAHSELGLVSPEPGHEGPPVTRVHVVYNGSANKLEVQPLGSQEYPVIRRQIQAQQPTRTANPRGAAK